MAGNIPSIPFTSRDLAALEQDVADYLPRYLPEITDVSQANPGRRLVRLIEGIVDTLHLSLDVAHIESLWGVTQQRRNLIEQAKAIGWFFPGVSTARATLRFTTSVVLPVGPGALTIPRFTVCQTSTTPARTFITIESGSIPEGGSTVSVAAVEGERVVQEVVTNSASGQPNQRYVLPANRVPFEFVQIEVEGNEWTRQPHSLLASTFVDWHFVCRILETNLLRTVVQFGNNEFGAAPPAGSRILATYIKCSGPDGNVAAGTINKVVGPIATPFPGITLSVTNDEAAAGGSDGPTTDEIRAKAPFEQQTRDVYVTAEDFRAGAESVPGVYTAKVVDILGSTATVIVLPNGGGIAPQILLDEVQTKLEDGALIGAVLETESVGLAEVLVTVDVQLLRTDISRQEMRERVIAAIFAATDYRLQEIGRGFRVSDISTIVKTLNNGTTVDFVLVKRLTRIPRPVKTDPSVPDMQGDIRVGSAAGYADYVIQPDTNDPTNKQFFVTRSGQQIVDQNGNLFGSVGVEFVSQDGAVAFTFGTTSDVFLSPNRVTFSTSKYLGNLQLAREEIMAVSRLSQLEVNVFYPGELDAFA